LNFFDLFNFAVNKSVIESGIRAGFNHWSFAAAARFGPAALALRKARNGL
jgi:hypothetical protein